MAPSLGSSVESMPAHHGSESFFVEGEGLVGTQLGGRHGNAPDPLTESEEPTASAPQQLAAGQAPPFRFSRCGPKGDPLGPAVIKRLAIAMVEVRNLVASMSVLIVIVLLTGEPINFQWLLLLPALFLQAVFNAGLALFVARLGAKLTDIKQLIPFIMRIWLYLSAVLYPVSRLTEHVHGWHLRVVEANPLLVFIELARHALLENVALAGTPRLLWIEALAWTLVVGFGGFVYFWRGEKGYGRG